MAYIRKQFDQSDPNALDKQNLQDEQGGFFGTGIQENKNQSNNQTIAGKPSGWTNLNAYLQGNPNAGQELGTKIQNKALGDIQTQSKEFNKLAGSYQAPKQAQGFNPNLFKNALEKNDYSSLTNLMNQQYNPTDVNKKYSDVQTQANALKTQFEGIKPGDYNSIMNYYGTPGQGMTNYTPGQGQLDKLFLQQNKPFIQNFGTQSKNALNQYLTKPLEQQKAAETKKETAAQQQSQQAGQDWTKGINTWLSGQGQALQTELGKEKETETARSQQKPQDLINQYVNPTQAAQIKQFGLSPSDYLSYQGSTPTLENAAKAIGLDVSDYNKLSAITGQGVSIGTPTAYQPGYWKLNQDLLGTQLTERQKQKIAKEAEENAKLKEATKANLIKGPDLTQPIQTRPMLSNAVGYGTEENQVIPNLPTSTVPQKEDLDYLNQFLGGRNTGMLTQGLY